MIWYDLNSGTDIYTRSHDTSSTRSTIDSWARDLNIYSAPISKHIVPTCAILMWHVQICGLIGSLRIWLQQREFHRNDVIMSTMASQITSLVIVSSAVYSGRGQRKQQSSASLAFVRGIHRWPVNSPHNGPVTQKMFPFDDVIIFIRFQSRVHEPFVKLRLCVDHLYRHSFVVLLHVPMWYDVSYKTTTTPVILRSWIDLKCYAITQMPDECLREIDCVITEITLYILGCFHFTRVPYLIAVCCDVICWLTCSLMSHVCNSYESLCMWFPQRPYEFYRKYISHEICTRYCCVLLWLDLQFPLHLRGSFTYIICMVVLLGIGAFAWLE